MTATRPAIKASTLHVRNYRERMREQGLVKKDVWIRPEYAEELAAIEKSMRDAERDAGIPYLPTQPAEAGWTVAAIRHALQQASTVRDGRISLETIEGAEPSLHLVMHEYGDLSVFLAVGGEQILVEAGLEVAVGVAAGEKGSEDGRSDVPGRTGEDDSHPVIVGTAADGEPAAIIGLDEHAERKD